MNKRNKINVGIEVHDMYQLLIAECRYGYGRNNHLMPWGAYNHVKTYLPLMYKKDPEFALHTACQLCEECISEQLTGNFFDGLDDENENRKQAIEFIKYLLDWIHEQGKQYSALKSEYYEHFYPYNYDLYKVNLQKEEELKYRVFELESFDREAKKIKELTVEPISKREADNLLFIQELGTTKGIINHIDIKTEEYPVRVIGELIRIVEPIQYVNRVFSIELVRNNE